MKYGDDGSIPREPQPSKWPRATSLFSVWLAHAVQSLAARSPISSAQWPYVSNVRFTFAWRISRARSEIGTPARKLNGLGAQDWELTTAVPLKDSDSLVLILSREKPTA